MMVPPDELMTLGDPRQVDLGLQHRTRREGPLQMS